MASDHGPDTISYFCFAFRNDEGKITEYMIDRRLARTWEKAEARFRSANPTATVEYRKVRDE